MDEAAGADGELPREPRARDDVVFRELAEEWVLFDPETRRLHVLNLTAALVWSFCTGEHPVDEITRRVRDSFDEPAEPDAVAADVRKALGTFVQEGLLVGAAKGPGGP